MQDALAVRGLARIGGIDQSRVQPEVAKSVQNPTARGTSSDDERVESIGKPRHLRILPSDRNHGSWESRSTF